MAEVVRRNWLGLSRVDLRLERPEPIGDVTIKPGDVALGDIDGVLIVPRDIAFDVLTRAEEIKANEKKIFGWVAEGQSIQQIKDKGGYF